MTDHSPGLARAYFRLQAGVAVGWYVALFLDDGIRTATLGDVDPRILIVPDILLFTLPSLLAAMLAPGSRPLKISLAALLGYSSFTVIFFGWRSLDGGRGAWGVIAMSLAFTGSVLAGTRLALGPLGAGLTFPSALRIRPAGEGSTARHLFRTLVQIVVFWGLFLGILPWAIAVLEARWNLRWPPLGGSGFAIAGWMIFATLGAIGLWSAVVMVVKGRGTPLPSEAARRLVTTGPYSVVRNPMAVAGILQGVGIGMVHGSWLAIAYAVTGSFVWNILARPYEEADMAERFGGEFEEYRRRVRCWIPGFGCRCLFGA